jgi:hypothetical protein
MYMILRNGLALTITRIISWTKLTDLNTFEDFQTSEFSVKKKKPSINTTFCYFGDCDFIWSKDSKDGVVIVENKTILYDGEDFIS